MNRFFSLALLALLFCTGTAAAQSRLESLLVEVGMPYAALGNNTYKVIVEVEGTSTPVFVTEVTSPLQMISVYTPTLDPGDGFQYPAAMLRKIAEINNNLLVGKVGLEEGKLFYISSIFTRTADAEALATELVLAHFLSKEINSALAPYTRG